MVPSIKVDELAKNHTEFPKSSKALYTTTFVMAMNKAKYEGLPPELKKVIDANSGLDTSAWLGKTPEGNDAIGRKVSVEKGGNIYTLSPQEADAFKKVATPIDDEWVADLTKRGFDGKKLHDTAHALIEQYTKG